MMSLAPDQAKFISANLAGLSLALPYKYVPRSLRNRFNYLPGILMIYYCFGRQANTLMIFSLVSYIVCRFTPDQYVQRLTLGTSLAFLSYAHLSRQIIDYGGYVLDISGPFMIAVQKMTSLGFCLHDGFKMKQESANSIVISETSEINNNDDIHANAMTEKLVSCDNSEDSTQKPTNGNNSSDRIVSHSSQNMTDEQRKYAITKVPSFNEFFGYFFHFPSVLCGPIMYFKDYKDFVDAPSKNRLPPGRHMAAFRKLTISITCAILHLTLNPKFEIEFLRSREFLVETHIVVRFFYIIVFTMLSRLKYYVAWHIGEAISNVSGLGFNGYNLEGQPKWNLISNMNLLKFETSLNLRDAIRAWNKTTQVWLKRTAYERVPKKFSVVAAYLLSAIWHGFYPGYYMTFLSGALFTCAARNGRRYIRPLFQRGSLLPKAYDAFTFLLTRVTIAYAAFPFVILDFRNNFEIYKSLYFSIHILALVGIALGVVMRSKNLA